MSMIGNGLIVGGALLIGAGTVSPLNPGGAIYHGPAIAAGALAIGAGLAVEAVASMG
ncbi:MAG: hypothetical protein QW568_01710 [Candidatus Anstonellaceae archaeon]